MEVYEAYRHDPMAFLKNKLGHSKFTNDLVDCYQNYPQKRCREEHETDSIRMLLSREHPLHDAAHLLNSPSLSHNITDVIPALEAIQDMVVYSTKQAARYEALQKQSQRYIELSKKLSTRYGMFQGVMHVKCQASAKKYENKALSISQRAMVQSERLVRKQQSRSLDYMSRNQSMTEVKTAHEELLLLSCRKLSEGQCYTDSKTASLAKNLMSSFTGVVEALPPPPEVPTDGDARDSSSPASMNSNPGVIEVIGIVEPELLPCTPDQASQPVTKLASEVANKSVLTATGPQNAVDDAKAAEGKDSVTECICVDDVHAVDEVQISVLPPSSEDIMPAAHAEKPPVQPADAIEEYVELHGLPSPPHPMSDKAPPNPAPPAATAPAPSGGPPVPSSSSQELAPPVLAAKTAYASPSISQPPEAESLPATSAPRLPSIASQPLHESTHQVLRPDTKEADEPAPACGCRCTIM